jgi:hypothetical protein
LRCGALFTFQPGGFFRGGVLAGETFGEALILPFSMFVGLLTGESDGAGVFVGDELGEGVPLRFSVFAGFATGVGVFAGGGFGDGVTLTVSALDFSRVGCCDSWSVAGTAIAVGSSIAVGCLTGVGVAGAESVSFGVDAVSGSNKRPRRCETVGDTDGCEVGVELAIGAGV